MCWKRENNISVGRVLYCRRISYLGSVWRFYFATRDYEFRITYVRIQFKTRTEWWLASVRGYTPVDGWDWRNNFRPVLVLFSLHFDHHVVLPSTSYVVPNVLVVRVAGRKSFSFHLVLRCLDNFVDLGKTLLIWKLSTAYYIPDVPNVLVRNL